MARDLIPSSFFNSLRIPNLFDLDWDEDRWLNLFNDSGSALSSGLAVSEDDKHIYVEAAVPGVEPDKVEVTYDKGILWIRGEQERKNEDKNKKYYRRASTSFSYRMALPGEVDMNKEPQATCKNGIMKVTFNKIPEAQPKKIAVKVE